MGSGAVLLNVHPLRFVETDRDGNWILPDQHHSLPDAIWLPVVGWGNIEGWAADYLVDSLREVTDQKRPVIVFAGLIAS